MEKDYIVKRRRDDKPVWAFQIYENKLQKKANEYGDFDIVVICDYKVPTQKTLRMSYSYIQGNILPKATKDNKGRYLFEVNKRNLKFNWRHGIPMEGHQFLLD